MYVIDACIYILFAKSVILSWRSREQGTCIAVSVLLWKQVVLVPDSLILAIVCMCTFLPPLLEIHLEISVYLHSHSYVHFLLLLFSPGLAVLDPAMITVFSPLMFLEATTVASDKDSLHVPLSPFSSEYFIAYVAVWVVASFLCCLI